MITLGMILYIVCVLQPGVIARVFRFSIRAVVTAEPVGEPFTSAYPAGEFLLTETELTD